MSKRKRAKQTHASSQIGKNQEVSQQLIQVWDLSEEQLKKFLEPKPKQPILDRPLRKDPLTADELRLLDLRRLLFHEKDLLENAALEEYTKKYPIDLKSFKEDVQSLKEGSLYDSFSRLYIGFNRDLAGTLISKSKKELRPGLHPVAEVLGNSDDVGVLITNKSEDEILKKFDGYQEFDLAKPGNTPMETLKYTKDHVLSLPRNRKAKILFGELQGLGMPVELIDGQKIKLTKDYVVCEECKCVTEKASKILTLLNIKMFNYVVQPRCCWTVSSGQTYNFKNYYDRYPWTSWPSRV
ncbi:hypothetical protein MKW98_006819 [Papaver atlanticum]|uniref:Uncharacterized protein n=1 Tax=Papaver atlanticum TaxID=357466 RepID=A0AAD4SV65_9MAGN|nr:hypothetical protein MKW98_006819 [Papaver atlanticum]